MTKRIFWLIISVIFTALLASAQQNNTWFFGGGAGLSFNATANPNIPFVITGNAMVADEGCAGISDINGSILFYTNGTKVYNKNNQLMLNGDGLTGHVSAFQSAVVVPAPGNDSLYYIFTADAYENNYVSGYRYSVVNMKHDGGLGEVVIKNTLLSAPASERITAVRHANGTDVWIITNEDKTNIFRCWLLNCNGIQPAPVVSAVGVVMDQKSYMSIGCLKASPDGKLLCQTHFPDDDLVTTGNFFQLFDFNASTGQISNARTIAIPNTNYYAAEFSPDSKLLYSSRADKAFTDQFECTLPSAAAIIASRVSIPSQFGYYGMQTGPDKKIYLTGIKYKLGVIRNPDIKGAGCNLVVDAVDLGGAQGRLNLPSVMNDAPLDPANGIRYQYLDSCNGVIQFQAVTVLSGPLQYAWDFGDGQTSNLPNPVHTFTPAGSVYNVKLKITSPASCGFIEKGVQLSGSGFSISPAFDIEVKCDSGYVRFVNHSVSSNDNLISYVWDFGDGQTSTLKNPVHSYSSSGNFTVTLNIVSTVSCLHNSVSHPLDLNQINVQAPADITIDFGQSVTLTPVINGTAVSVQWSPPTWLNNATTTSPVATPQLDTSYVVKVTNVSGCVDMDTVRIFVRPVKDIFIPSGFTPNTDGRNDEIRPLFGPTFSLLEFSVYTRWGQRVFTSSTGSGWNGKNAGADMPAGAYVYVVRARKLDGTEVMKKGSFVLIR